MTREQDNPPDPDLPAAPDPTVDAPEPPDVSLPGRGLIALVRLYQATLSPLIGRQCRFHPTCSSYFIEAVQKRGALIGALKGLWRICRCNPFCKGGYDPVE